MASIPFNGKDYNDLRLCNETIFEDITLKIFKPINENGSIICWFAPPDEYSDGYFRVLEQSTLKQRCESISTNKN